MKKAGGSSPRLHKIFHDIVQYSVEILDIVNLVDCVDYVLSVFFPTHPSPPKNKHLFEIPMTLY